MNMGDMYAFIDRVENGTPVRMLAFCLRVDDIGAGLNLPQLTAIIFPLSDDANHAGVPFYASTGLYEFGSNVPNTFEPITEPV